jgi:formylglycine-generating enzyme required for sulfatase activity
MKNINRAVSISLLLFLCCIASPSQDSLLAVKKNDLGMEFILIPKGEFEMGSSNAELNQILAECKRAGGSCKKESFTDESPKRKISINSSFWLGRYEVTQEQWEKVMGINPSTFKECGPSCPVDNVSWNDAKRFVSAMNSRNDGFFYSLPSEAQWEYASRAGAQGLRYGAVDEVSWFMGNSGGTTRPVGGKTPNQFGLYDMLGNVFEWVEDYYARDFTAAIPIDGSPNLIVGMPLIRVAKGCSWGCSSFNTRSGFRFNNLTSERTDGNGLRLVARER